MTVKRIVRRERAERDIEEAGDSYFDQGGEQPELRFLDALEAAFKHIGKHPATGSRRYAVELNQPGLRFWPVKRFPYLIFYVERADYVDALRVLHDARDLPAWLRDGDAES